jgi:ribosome-associated protein
MNSPKKIAATAVEALEDKKGQSIQILEISEISTLADYFVICTGTLQYTRKNAV